MTIYTSNAVLNIFQEYAKLSNRGIKKSICVSENNYISFYIQLLFEVSPLLCIVRWGDNVFIYGVAITSRLAIAITL